MEPLARRGDAATPIVAAADARSPAAAESLEATPSVPAAAEPEVEEEEVEAEEAEEVEAAGEQDRPTGSHLEHHHDEQRKSVGQQGGDPRVPAGLDQEQGPDAQVEEDADLARVEEQDP